MVLNPTPTEKLQCHIPIEKMVVNLHVEVKIHIVLWLHMYVLPLLLINASNEEQLFHHLVLELEEVYDQVNYDQK